MEVIQSELRKKGMNELFHNGKIVAFDDDFAFIKKAMKYDADVHEVVTDFIFLGYEFSTSEIDKKFKKTFVNRFLNKQIEFQTIELFSATLLSIIFSYEDHIESIYSDMEKYFNAQSESETTNQGTSQSDSRYLASELPQNTINLNVDDTVLNYGNQNNISRNKNQDEGSSKTVSKQYNLESLLKAKTLIDDVFTEIERKCFYKIG